eukprot:TRINITY_DN88299_c0_g2_i2.p1 TRINITY_DN88299_c0_g2~~TRINITY_DN88299_c0_g2_i2.p1  ORF type:complete len:126 (-),score=18.87 TRINITY_DN88299_c0_g2_i2:204-581(-)
MINFGVVQQAYCSAAQQQIKNEAQINNDQQMDTEKPAQQQQLDELVEQALACPCIEDLKEGVCGKSFINAFTCFITKKEQLEKGGGDCMSHFYDLQNCLVAHPEVFKEFMGNEHLFQEQSMNNTT